MLRALAEEAGAEAIVLPTARDEASVLDELIELALKTAENLRGKAPVLLVIAGGVSVGRFDLVEAALARRNARFHFTGVAIQPGKPVVFGEIPTSAADSDESTLKFFGLPGNPVSAAVTFRLFVEPVLSALAGSNSVLPRFSVGHLETAWKGKAGLMRFLPAVCDSGAMGSVTLPTVRLIPWQSSGDIAAFADSNCLVVIPAEASEIEAGEKVQILPR
jgi:molybdopterin molybdotransferase